MQIKNNEDQLQSIMNDNYQMELIDPQFTNFIYTGAISNNLKFIIAGSQQYLKIWDFKTKCIFKSIKFAKNYIYCIKFTKNSRFLYVGTNKIMHQLFVNNKFKQLCKKVTNDYFILNIHTIKDAVVLSSSYNGISGIIVKTDFQKKQQLFKIQAHNFDLYGLDYNQNLNMIASGSSDRSIKIWNGKDGSFILENLNAHGKYQAIFQVLFLKDNQLISLAYSSNLIIWNINFQIKQLEQLKLIENSGNNISLVLQQQILIATGRKSIDFYTINGDLIRQLEHQGEDTGNIKSFNQLYILGCFNTIQPESMKAILIQGKQLIQVCKIDMV